MTDSILLTVKKMLGIAEEYKAFDIDVITNINSVFLTLNQLGIGSPGFQITGDAELWSEFIDTSVMPGIQTYVYLKTKLLFDPPTNSFLVDSIQKQIEEFEFRLNVQAEYITVETKPEPTDPEKPSESDSSDNSSETSSSISPNSLAEVYAAYPMRVRTKTKGGSTNV